MSATVVETAAAVTAAADIPAVLSVPEVKEAAESKEDTTSEAGDEDDDDEAEEEAEPEAKPTRASTKRAAEELLVKDAGHAKKAKQDVVNLIDELIQMEQGCSETAKKLELAKQDMDKSLVKIRNRIAFLQGRKADDMETDEKEAGTGVVSESDQEQEQE